ncbi:MAG TPA: alpha/beta hydrolase [Solirubrobacterales bacterium]|nr:alpha/beta hydrolase [Solirubrobacterales bacterium]
MHARPKEAFEAAQAAVLDRFGVEAESRLVDVPELEGRAHVLVAGEGPPVVMLNGIGTPAAMWAPLMVHIEGTLHAVDLPAYGLTDAPRQDPVDLRAHAVGFLEGVLEGLGVERATFVSNSLGSLWALWLAMDEPARVDATAHVGCPAVAPGTSAPLPMRMLSTRVLGPLLMRLQPPSPMQVERLSKLVGQHPLTPEIAAAILATERMPGFERTFRSNLRALVRLRGARPRSALTESQLSAVGQRTLLVFARQDPMGSERAGCRMAQALPNAELHLCDGGHCPWLDETERVADLINAFLERSASDSDPSRV